jgi:uncharacterized protein (TIGR00251 family)
MIIKVKVKPGSGREKISKKSDGEYEIWLKERAEGGNANRKLIKLFAKEFNVKDICIKIKNAKGRKKIVKIEV